MHGNLAVKTENLEKRYHQAGALENFNLELEKGKIYGLLGRNGAGKTTLLNILAARIFPTGGKFSIFGENVYENIKILQQICYIEEKGFYNNALRIGIALKLCEDLYPSWDRAYAAELIELFELDVKKKYKQLSRGMESSLGLIIGLASRAPLTIFDEPSLGLDAVMRERFYDALLEDVTRHPRTIIISSHLIDEISRLFEEILILERGKLLLHTEAAKLEDRAFYISGREEAVRAAAGAAVILEEESFGGTFTLCVYARDGLKSGNDVEIQPMPLQKLFVLLTDPKRYGLLKKSGVVD